MTYLAGKRSLHAQALGFLAGTATACWAAGAGAATVAFPLKASADNRYLVDQDNVPFLMVGDSPQAMIGNLSKQDAAFFISDRANYGINALWVNLLCDAYTACNADGTTYDGIAPFTTAGDLSTPNPKYFDRAADMIQLAAASGMVVLLDPAETGGWLGVLEANGVKKSREYGRFLGRRFGKLTNIIWLSGNDFQSWQNPYDNAVVGAVAQGIKDAEAESIHTIELNYYVSASLDDRKWRTIGGVDAVYTYRPTYAKELSEYKRTQFKPTFLVEANYEFEQNGGTDGGSTQNLRRQEYWTALSGTTGQLYGSHYSWTLNGDWKDNLDTIGIQELSWMKGLIAPLDWYDLVPDRDHQVLTQGYGHFSKTDHIPDDTYATAAATPDGKLALAYLPDIRKVTIDMAKFAGAVTAQWFDPTNDTFQTISGSPFQNTGTQNFTPPGNNVAGDADWVLDLEVE
ncbi:MAG TPA: DUF4038 domain-containing protein [Rhizomicrobium sp.]|jgi:hypothetical protein|nr:DUF4038 domain-containing protein [Rhizomicrobium sp.]